MCHYVNYSNMEFKFGLLKNLTRLCLYKTEKPLSALAVRLSGVSATLVPTDSHKQPIPLFPPQIWRGQGKWWMASPLGCQGLLILRWIIPQKPPSSSITPTPHRECDVDFSQRVVDYFRKDPKPRELKCCSHRCFLNVCEQMIDASEEQGASWAGTTPVSSRSQANVLTSARKRELL